MRPVPLSLCAGIRPVRAHLTSVRCDTRKYSEASPAVIHGELGTVDLI